MRANDWRTAGFVAAGLLASIPFATAQNANPFDEPVPANRAQQIQAESQRQNGDLSDDSSTKVAGLFGKSDEEIAAEQAAAAAVRQHEQSQDSQIATLTQQNADLQTTVQRLTGQNESLGHRVDEFESKISKMQKDFDYRICMLAQQQFAGDSDTSSADAPPAINCSGTSTAAASPLPPSSTQVAGPSGPVVLAPLPTPPDSQKQYDSAMKLLAKLQYDEARSTFQGIVDTNPDDTLAPQALYWVGDIAYVQKDYQSAARSFAQGLKKYPSSENAPESMLKLGQSLIAMGKKEEGCTTLGAIKEKFPKDPIDKKATAARKAASCH